MSTTVDLEVIKKIVEDSGLKKRVIAERIGVRQETLSRFLNGKLNLGRPAMILLAQVLGVSESDLKKAS